MFEQAYNWARSRRIYLVIFAAMAGLYFFTNFQRIGVPGTVFDEMQSDFGASASQVTALAAIFLYVYAGMQFFVGAGADRFGPAKIVLAGGALLTLGSIAFPYCRSLPQVYATRVIVGLGASVMYISIIKQIVNTFEPRYFPPLLGVLLVVGYSGGVVATMGLASAVTAYGWRASFEVVAACCAVVFAIVLLLLVKTGGVRKQKSTFSFDAAVSLLKQREVWPILITGALNFGVYYVLQMTLGKKFLEDFLGMSSAAAASVNGAMLITVTIGYMAGGFLPRLAGERRKPFVIIASVATFAAAAMLYFGVTANLPAWWFVTAYVLLGATNSPAIVGTALMKEITPPATAAFGISMLNAACYVAVAVASTVIGFVLDAYEPAARLVAGHKIYPGAAYAAIFAGMSVLAILTTVVSFFVPETRGVQRGA